MNIYVDKQEVLNILEARKAQITKQMEEGNFYYHGDLGDTDDALLYLNELQDEIDTLKSMHSGDEIFTDLDTYMDLEELEDVLTSDNEYVYPGGEKIKLSIELMWRLQGVMFDNDHDSHLILR